MLLEVLEFLCKVSKLYKVNNRINSYFIFIIIYIFIGSTGAAGPRLFTIHAVDAPSENLPKAHTCFNRIDIPESYPSYQKMLDKLTQAVEETCGFAVE